MKSNKTISLDSDLISSLNELGLNVSKFCNEHLWTYVTEAERKGKDIKQREEDIGEEIKLLEEERDKAEADAKKAERLKLAGITDEKYLYLKNMSSNIMNAKDTKLGFLNKFGESLTWAELVDLKEKYT